MKNVLAVTCAGLILTACGPTTTGPGEISAYGLVYDQRPGRSFEGLPLTQESDMPTGRIEMTGPSSATDTDGTIVFADATLTVDTDTGGVNYVAQYEFPDGGPVGILAVNLDATLDGTSFQGDDNRGHLDGDFYGQDGEVAAGFWSLNDDVNGSYAHGAFIVGSEGR